MLLRHVFPQTHMKAISKTFLITLITSSFVQRSSQTKLSFSLEYKSVIYELVTNSGASTRVLYPLVLVCHEFVILVSYHMLTAICVRPREMFQFRQPNITMVKMPSNYWYSVSFHQQKNNKEKDNKIQKFSFFHSFRLPFLPFVIASHTMYTAYYIAVVVVNLNLSQCLTRRLTIFVKIIY